MKVKQMLALAATLVLGLSLAACGTPASTSAKPASSTPPADSASTASSAATDTAATPTIDAIKAKGKLIMMTATGFPPFEYLGESGKPAGVDIDIAQMVADEIGVPLEVLDMDFALLIESLKSGKGDLVAAGMTISDERKTQIDFTDTYASAGQMLLVPTGSTIKTAEDLKDKKIAVQESTTGHLYVQEELGLEVMAFKNAIECANAVSAGKADVSVVDSIPAKALVKNSDGKLEAVEPMLTAEDYAIGIAKGQEDLVALVNEVIAKAQSEGKIEELMTMHDEIVAEG